MVPLKLTVLLVLGINLLAIFFASFHIAERNVAETGLASPYKFNDPVKAYFLLTELDVYGIVEDGFIARANYSGVAGGWKINNHYCDDHRAYIVDHPESIFNQKNIITNYNYRHKLRSQVIPAIGAQDLHPEINGKRNLRIEDSFSIDMRVEANLFLMSNLFFYRRQVGKQFSCLSQASNHIPGHDTIYRKDNVGQALVDYAIKYGSKPSCFSFDRYFPRTWILQQEDQCLDFFKEFLSNKYQDLKKERNVVYFRKIGADVHEGKGVFPVNHNEEAYIQSLYQNGTLCGKIRDNNLIQYNIHNLLLLNNRKFGFRMFMLVASTNPLLVYYHDGYARLSLNEYDARSNEINTFVTNIGVNLKEAEKGTGMTAEQIQESTLWFMQDFQDYMMQNGLISDPDWLDNYLRPELKRIMIHLIRMGSSTFAKKSSVFELYGLDFVMDEKLDLWFIECNTMPLVDGFTARSTKQLNKMLKDTIQIEMGLIRSRMKRVINYINILSEESVYDSFFSSLRERRKEFKELTKNYFEPEFEPSPDNGFQMIVDERLYGKERYAGLIKSQCI